jgi:hypothetical protein
MEHGPRCGGHYLLQRERLLAPWEQGRCKLGLCSDRWHTFPISLRPWEDDIRFSPSSPNKHYTGGPEVPWEEAAETPRLVW